MSNVISICNQKGGVAKTTSAFNVGYILSRKGHKVLLVDLDPQASLTIYAGLEPYEYENTIIDVLRSPKQDLHRCIQGLRDGLDMITSRIELAAVENELLGKAAREKILARALQQVRDEYDYILGDKWIED